MERHGTQYRGNSQHDAQEFLFWLLDKVHEDLNTATKRKYKTIKVFDKQIIKVYSVHYLNFNYFF